MPFVASAGVERRTPHAGVSPGWPITRLGAWGLTLLLIVSMLAPALLDGGAADRAPSLVLCAALATAATRAMFAILTGAGRGGALGGAPAVIAAALAGGVTVAGVSKLFGIAVPPIVDLSTALAAAVVLVMGSTLRVIEVRYALGLRRVYLVGSDSSQRAFEHELARHPDVTLVGRAVVSKGRCDVSGQELQTAIIATRASVLVLDGSAMQIPELADSAPLVGTPGVRVWDLVSYYEHKLGKVPLAELTPGWFAFDTVAGRERRFADGLRRAVDVGVAGVLLLLVCLPLLVAGMMIRLTSPGPALYRQRRVGRDGRPFTLLKLRTMLQGSDEPAWAGSEGQRVTRLGRHLRRFRLDELPQLWNVLRADLALIGPRPEQVAIAARLARELPNYEFRHCIRPGITGWAQVHLGYAGSAAGAAAKLQRDLYYVKRRSLRLDLLIAWLTLRMVLEGRE